MTTRERIHQLVDQVPEDTLIPVLVLLRDIQAGHDPVLAAHENALEEDEEISPEEEAAVEEARRAVAAGRVIPHEQVCRELGL